MTVRQLWVQAEEYNAIDDRAVIAALLPRGPGPIATTVGLRDADDLALTMTGPHEGTVSPGAAFVALAGSVYVLSNDTPTPVTFGPADPTLARIDALIGWVHDADAGGATEPAGIVVLPGQPAANPVVPALPAGAILLATVRYNPGSTAPIVTEVGDAIGDRAGRYLGAAPITGANFPQAGGTLGFTGGANVAAVPWPRLVQVNLRAMATSGSGAPDITLRANSTEVDRVRINGLNMSASLTFTEVVPAGHARQYQGIAIAIAALGITNNPVFTSLNVYDLGPAAAPRSARAAGALRTPNIPAESPGLLTVLDAPGTYIEFGADGSETVHQVPVIGGSQ